MEDLGVVPDHRHELTRRDVLEDNVDLLDAAGALLGQRPRRTLRMTSSRDGGGTLTLQVTTAGSDRLDVYVDGRPRASADISDGSSSLTVSRVAGAVVVRVKGHTGGKLVAARTQQI